VYECYGYSAVSPLAQPRLGCEVYQLGADDVCTPIPLREKLRRGFPSFPPLPADWPDYRNPLLTDKAQEHFGWRPACSLRTAYRAAFGKDVVEERLDG
jgi:hypothetical protein